MCDIARDWYIITKLNFLDLLKQFIAKHTVTFKFLPIQQDHFIWY